MTALTGFRLTLVAAESVALFLGAQIIIAAFTEGQGPSLPVMLVATFAGVLCVWLVDHLDVPQQRVRLLVAVATVVVTLFLLRIEYGNDVAIWDFGWLTSFIDSADETLRGNSHIPMGAIAIAVAWFRGVQREAGEVLPEEAVKELGWAFIVAGAAVVLARPFDAGSDVYGASILFLALALAALALAQVSDLQQPLAFKWAGSGLATTGILVGVGAGLAFAFALAWGPLEDPLRDAFGAIALIVLTALVMPFIWLFEAIDWATGGAIRFNPDALRQIPQDVQDTTRDEPRDLTDGERAVGAGLRALIVLGGALLIGGIVYWMAQRYQRLKRGAPPPAPLSARAGSPAEDAKGLLGMLRGLRGRGRSSRGNILGVYEWVLDEAAERGQARPAGVTPSEFLPPLQRAFPGPAPVAITRAYERARYGDEYPSATELRHLVADWQEALKSTPASPSHPSG